VHWRFWSDSSHHAVTGYAAFNAVTSVELTDAFVTQPDEALVEATPDHFEKLTDPALIAPSARQSHGGSPVGSPAPDRG
jgi:hypothetical protein